jgi:hypothetical protein
MPTTTSPLTPTTHGLRVAASFNVLYGPINAVEQGGGYSIVTSVGFVKNQCAPLTLASQPALEGVTFYGIRSENFSTIFDVLALGGGEFPKLWNWSQLGDV